MKTVIVICAFNEPYISDVVKNLEYKWPIIVVDDGSKEEPVPDFRQENVHVARLKNNRGKGYAMKFGFKRVSEKYPMAEVVVFADADLINFKPKHVEAMLEALNSADMVGGRFKPYKLQDIFNFLIPFLSGQRAAKTVFWKGFFAKNTITDFGIETSINVYAKMNGCVVKNIILDGVSQHLKEKKYGFIYGIKKRLKMYKQIVRAIIYAKLKFKTNTRK
ncbi:MAG: Glycosyl transferase family 2 [candidate division CPR2 bacterium GW2011_GWC1_39_9]|uniref:Glycosyl transferase family 2 n=1 Tax=candidate division CPR2 bacterium GW2011_GWC2_39_10 TaxID=1618345 RepID=A0A0G0PZF2_UNCC2|nr:MAG: Glycosyl transferase family 2 [candidate division CPR2 bacterium GW2011_GWC2_39_10]KKR34135.1 MAG: Glycosyl transferase family 2 [candidate division CPR2 bacterium GW2011_GWC1_39_9]